MKRNTTKKGTARKGTNKKHTIDDNLVKEDMDEKGATQGDVTMEDGGNDGAIKEPARKDSVSHSPGQKGVTSKG